MATDRRSEDFVSEEVQKWLPQYFFSKGSQMIQEQSNTNVDDIVILEDDSLNPTKYKLDRIVRIYHEPDGKIRVVEVETSQGQIWGL